MIVVAITCILAAIAVPNDLIDECRMTDSIDVDTPAYMVPFALGKNRTPCRCRSANVAQLIRSTRIAANLPDSIRNDVNST
jgi:hypothetical protein